MEPDKSAWQKFMKWLGFRETRKEFDEGKNCSVVFRGKNFTDEGLNGMGEVVTYHGRGKKNLKISEFRGSFKNGRLEGKGRDDVLRQEKEKNGRAERNI